MWKGELGACPGQWLLNATGTEDGDMERQPYSDATAVGTCLESFRALLGGLCLPQSPVLPTGSQEGTCRSEHVSELPEGL